MKQKINPIKCLYLFISCLILPVLYIHHTTGNIQPFYLTGKEFLSFFGILSCVSLMIAGIWLVLIKRQANRHSAATINNRIPGPEHCIFLVLIIGFVRLIQGIINAKPVGFLVMLLFVNILLLIIIRSIKTKI